MRPQRPVCLLIMGELCPERQSLLQALGRINPGDAQRIIVTHQAACHMANYHALAQERSHLTTLISTL